MANTLKDRKEQLLQRIKDNRDIINQLVADIEMYERELARLGVGGYGGDIPLEKLIADIELEAWRERESNKVKQTKHEIAYGKEETK